MQNLSVFQRYNPVGHKGSLLIMGNQQNRLPITAVRQFQQFDRLFRILPIQIASRSSASRIAGW